MKILFIATKTPWPVVDGGRFLLRNTLEGLARRGHEATLVAPMDPGEDREAAAAALSPVCRPRLIPSRLSPLATSALRASFGERPISVVRHAARRVRREVEDLLARERFDVVHAEQLQALTQAAPAFAGGLPVVLRAQNVESDLWAATAGLRKVLGPVARYEAAKLARWEGRAVRRAARTVALTRRDALRLQELAGGGAAVRVVRAPFPASLPPGRRRLAGEPAVVLLGSEGWLPNRDAASFFVTTMWPEVAAALPEARLHVFGGRRFDPSGPHIEWHPPVEDSRDAFPPGAVLAVPLRIASGVRMKILEAWARGVPVVATPQAAAGLEAEDGRELLLAATPAELVRELTRLAGEGGRAEQLIAAGRQALERWHDPELISRQLESLYAELAGRSPSLR